MLEIRAEFRSFREWTAWAAQNRPSFEQWRAAILDDINRYGIVEPISEVRHDPRAITINPANLRESVSAGQLNSRMRAGLFALDLARRGLPAERRHHSKILGAEAVTRSARVLRGTFPHFIGAEYLPTIEERERHYPIPHLDLMDPAFPDDVFDLFYSSDILGKVPDMLRALSKIAQMLRPDGIMISTFPFNLNSEQANDVTALARQARSVEPEHGDNPVPPVGGSPVFSAPGWDILARAKEAGFADARMTLIASSAHGIVSAPLPGIFVMSALKASSVGSTHRLAQQEIAYNGPRLSRVIGLAGLPRSGTTLLTSVLGVHSRIEAIFEPYNSSKRRELPPVIGIDNFFAVFPTAMGAKDVLLVKETGTYLNFLDRLSDLLRSVGPPITGELILLLRNPLHAFLSEIEARRKWWGGTHTEVSAAAFGPWAERTLGALARLLRMGREFNPVVVSYEALVARKERLIPELMGELRLASEPRQLNFEKHLDRSHVRGDMTLAGNPSPISDDRLKERTRELAEVSDQIKDAAEYARMAEIARLLDAIAEVGVARFDTPAVRRVIGPVQKILAA